MARLIKKKKEKTYTAANIKNEKGDIISYPADIKKMISKLYATNLKIYKNGQIPRKIKLIKTQKELENLNNSLLIKGIESVI